MRDAKAKTTVQKVPAKQGGLDSPSPNEARTASIQRGKASSLASDERVRESRQESKAELAAGWAAAEAATRYRSQLAVVQAKIQNEAPREQGLKPLEARSEPTLKIVDLRKQAQARRAGGAAALSAEGKPDMGLELSKDEAGPKKETVRELGLDLSRGQKSLDPGAVQPKGEPAAAGSADFRALLAERLRESWNGEIVKSAQILLRDGDSGLIRLRLRPESLGGVKIELNLSDNNISGKIVVESDEARSAFERSLGDLADAFRAGGFESASLEVSVGSDGGERAGSERGTTAFFSERLQEATEPEAESVQDRRRSLVDILA